MLAARSEKPQISERNRNVLVAVAALGVLCVIAWFLYGLFSGPVVEPRKAQKITLINQPPPPPPKPPEKPPEPPKIKEEIKVEPPRVDDAPKPTESPPPAPLGLDASGSGAGDSFGLAANKGGRDIIASGVGGMGGATLFGSATARFIAQELARITKLRGLEYRIELKVWIAKDGRFERWEIVRGTGDAELDRNIREGLTQVGALRQPVPEGLPQPIRIRVTSSDA